MTKEEIAQWAGKYDPLLDKTHNKIIIKSENRETQVTLYLWSIEDLEKLINIKNKILKSYGTSL